MLKWLGHDAVAVLDGGWGAWQAMGGAVAQGPGHSPTPSNWEAGHALVSPVSAETVMARLGTPGQTIMDARATPRYRGDVEPLDPVAGHIPGALNRPFALNLDDKGCFKPAEQLRAEFLALLDGRAPASVVHQCGSGVGIIDAIAQRLVEFAPGGATGVQQRLPAQIGNKGIQLRALKAIGAVIMEAILNLMRFQPAAGFFNGIAVFNSVHGEHR